MQPGIPILKEGGRKFDVNEAWKYNMTSAVLVADLVKTAIGPHGHYKILVDYLDNVKITSRGATILRKLTENTGPRQDERQRPYQDNPCVKHLVESGLALYGEVGDGVITSVSLTGALLEQAAELIRMKVHRNVIESGYRFALSKALETLHSIKIPMPSSNASFISSVLKTTLSKHFVGIEAAGALARILTEAYFTLLKNNGGDLSKLDFSKTLQIVVKAGSSTWEPSLIYGIIVDKQLKHPLLPRRVTNAKIALIDFHMSVNKPKYLHEVKLTSPAAVASLKREEDAILAEMAEKLYKLGVNAVFCNKSIDDRLLYMLGRRNILAVRDVHRVDFEMLEKSCSARIVHSVDELKLEDLGYAELVEERDIGAETWIFVEGCRAPKAVSILIRGGSYWFAEEVKEIVKSALKMLRSTLLNGFVLPGGAASEVYVAERLKMLAAELKDKRQFVVEAFAKALEKNVLNLLGTAGVDPLKALADIRHLQSLNGVNNGFDLIARQVADVVEKGIMDSLVVKEMAWKTAVETACSILRVDEVFWAGRRAWKDLPKISEKSMDTSRKGLIGEPGSVPMYGEPY
ncbi:MAG: thermosome subunit beta [Candidatus Caldarchaeum sp.]